MATFQRPRSTPHGRPFGRCYNSVMDKDRLKLKAVIKSADLAAFIALAEAEGFGAADGEALKRALTAVAKPKQSKRQTSRAPSDD